MRLDDKELTPKQAAQHRRLQADLEYYCAKALKIKTKDGKLEPFIWNKAQRYIHECIETQKAETGMVRVLILKGRQQGCSTYVGARFFKGATWEGNTAVYILSHEGESTKTLLGKVQTYWEKSPEVVRPEITIGNKNEFKFENGSTYRVGTAGAKNTGRSQTNKLFHGSEVAFYDNTESISSGVLQTIADIPDTEIILESTANGVGDFYHTACMDALEGRGRYRLIFVPWHWQDEYTSTPPLGWDFSDNELELKEMYGLTDGQLYWRYLKIIELKSERLFKQEYPFTVQEAFQSSGSSLLKADAVQRARKSSITDAGKPMIMGVDPGRTGDRTVISLRRGREFVKVIKYDEMESTMRLAGICARLIEKYNVAKCFIDYGLGYGTVDRLHELGFTSVVTGIHFGGGADDPTKFLNKRVEMAFELRDWLDEGGCSIPDDEEIEVDLLVTPDFKQNSRGLSFLEPKDKIKETYGKSTDIFDSMMLTFAYPVATELQKAMQPKQTLNTKKGSALKTLRRVRGAGIDESDPLHWGPEQSPDYSQYRRR
jgi:hypothetical protein